MRAGTARMALFQIALRAYPIRGGSSFDRLWDAEGLIRVRALYFRPALDALDIDLPFIRSIGTQDETGFIRDGNTKGKGIRDTCC